MLVILTLMWQRQEDWNLNLLGFKAGLGLYRESMFVWGETIFGARTEGLSK